MRKSTPDDADRGDRLTAALLDVALALPFVVGWGLLAQRLLGPWQQTLTHRAVREALLVVCLAPYLAYQWRLIVRTGQSLGKRWRRMRIVCVDGRPLDWMSGVVLRQVVLNGLCMLLFVLAAPRQIGSVLGSLDVLLIFGAQRRCLHDYLAGTRVVRVYVDVPPS